MKKITLLIDDDVYKELKNGMGIRYLTNSAYGLEDAFITKLIKSIDKGEKEVEIKYKDKK